MGEPGFARNTSERTKTEWAQGLLTLVTGLTIAHLGVTLFLVSGLGSDPFTIFIEGLARSVGLSIGTVHVIVLISLMALMLLTTKGYVKPGTAVCAFLGGWIIDFFLWVLGGRIGPASPMPVRLAVMVLGVIVLSLGMSVVIKSNSGTGPNDLIAMILTDKISAHRPVGFRWVRIGCDVFFALVGLALGGTIGIGTAAAIVLTGPAVQFFLPHSEKAIHLFFPSI